MKTIKSIPYEQDFYWQGKRYRQVIRPKNPKGKFNIIVRLADNPCRDWLEMPSGRKVKPIVRVTDASS